MFSVVAVVGLEDLKLDGELGICASDSATPGRWTTDTSLPADRDSGTESGNTTSRFFCKSCGAPVHTQGPSRPGKTVVKMGLFARMEAGKLGAPAAEIFTANRNSWETVRELDCLHLRSS